MPIQAVEPRRLYRQIADQLRSLIRGGEYPVGTRLPPERDLAVQLGVSRPSVREALIALEVEGLVEVRGGSGIHILAREPAATARQVEPNAFGPFEIIRARQLIEGELAALAAQRMSPAQVHGLREALAEFSGDIQRGVLPIHGDRLFHLRIAEAADNGPLLRVVTELFDERNSPLFEQLGQHFEAPETWRLAQAEHQAVLEAIAAGDPAAAGSAMRLHLQRSHDRFADAWPQAAQPASTAAA
jgi:GntR family transcriptional regulator, transcriptional repressor for pyruvate dehydrogenase complex